MLTGINMTKSERKMTEPSGPMSTRLSNQISSVAQSCPTLFDPVDCSTPDLPVHHQLPELTQIHVH